MNPEVSKYMRQLQRKSADSRWSGLSAVERAAKMSALAKARWAKTKRKTKRVMNRRSPKRAAGCAPPAGSALAIAIADALMLEPWMNRMAARLQLRGPNEEDWGGNCRASVIRCIDAVLAQNG